MKAQDSRILDENYARLLKKRNGVERLLCHRCGREVHLGSRVHVHQSQRRNLPNSFRIYHFEPCWRELWIEC